MEGQIQPGDLVRVIAPRHGLGSIVYEDFKDSFGIVLQINDKFHAFKEQDEIGRWHGAVMAQVFHFAPPAKRFKYEKIQMWSPKNLEKIK